MRGAASSIAVALLLAAPSARAQAKPPSLPTADLDYRVSPGLTCPTAEQLRADVATEMGYDALSGGPGAGRFHVSVSRDRQPRVLLVRVAYDDASGNQDFETEFTGNPITARECAHLVQKHAVAEIVMQLSLEMLRARRDQSAAACPEAKPCPACIDCKATRFDLWPPEMPMQPLRKPEPDPPKPPERFPVAIRVGASVWPELVVAGWGSFGISAEIGARSRFASLSAEIHGDPSLGSVLVNAVGSVSFARVSGAVLPCLHWGYFAGCGVADVGRFLFPNHVQVLPASLFYGAVGARAGLELPVVPSRFFIRAAFDVRAAIRPANYVFQGNTIFASAGPGVGFGLGALIELPP